MLGRNSGPARRASGDRSTDRLAADPDATILAVQGDHARFEGKIQIADSVEVQCEVGGELEVGGRLIIGENGAVRADVRTVDAVILGTYEGNMIATGDVQIASTGRVRGSVTTDSLVISEGGLFSGSVSEIGNGASGHDRVRPGDDERFDSEAPASIRRVEPS
ncbi:MAG: bactofilin family protein [Gemmatimonadota bacterium]